MPVLEVGPFTAAIIVACVVSYVAALFLPKDFTRQLMLQPFYVMRENRWYQLFTSGFMHASLLHLGVNMLTFYFFGPVIEQSMGTLNFAGLYFFSLIISGIPSVIRHRANPGFATLGASGAVGGVVFAFIMFFPTRSLYLFFLPIPIPALVFGLLFLIYSFIESKRNRGKVNHDAHIAGSLAGVLYVLVAVPRYFEHLLTLLGLI
jgi:membrane associated rhomboid family serine protease